MRLTDFHATSDTMNRPHITSSSMPATSPSMCNTTPATDSDSQEETVASTRAPMKNSSRERMKVEKAALRTEAQELERQLTRLLASRALDRCRVTPTVWRSLAKRQAARREKSEQERDRLRAQLVQQLQFAKTLEVVLRNRANEMTTETTMPSQPSYPVDNLALLHDQFMDEIDQLYPLVDTLFADPLTPQDAMVTSLQRSVVPQPANGDKQLVVELRDATFVPFEFERVCNALWRAITTEYSRQQRLVEEYRCTDEEYTCSFTTHKDDSESRNLMSGMAMRKFTEANRVVVVWRSVDWDPTTQIKHGFGDDMGWLVVTPAMDASTGERSSEGAIVRVCSRCMPIWDLQDQLIQVNALPMEASTMIHEPSDQLVKGEVTQRILKATEVDIASITESIENILLGELVGPAENDLEDMIDDLLGFPHHVHDEEIDSVTTED